MNQTKRAASANPQDDSRLYEAWHAVGDLYHACFTGLIMTIASRKGQRAAADFVFRVFRRQQQERFLLGIERFGLKDLPHAVACAQYHYLGNMLGGVPVQFIPESDRKAWIRYPAPRWMWRGTAICAIPGEVSLGMMLGWHANNGVSLGNPRLGFVCTKQMADGQDGLEGFYYEYDRELAPHERLAFARHLEAPDFDPALAPRLEGDDWPRSRIEKSYRNYAMEYVRTALPVVVEQFGPIDAGHLLHLTGRLVGMQFHEELAPRFGAPAGAATEPIGIREFGEFLAAFLDAHGDRADRSESASVVTVTQDRWRLADAAPGFHPVHLEALAGVVSGFLAAANRRLAVGYASAPGDAGTRITWTISHRHPATMRSSDERYPA